MVLVSDGVSSVLSDDEIIDLARTAPDPTAAARRILSFSQELGGDDNATVIVVPLPGWGKVEGPDQTKELREYRRLQAGESKVEGSSLSAHHLIPFTFNSRLGAPEAYVVLPCGANTRAAPQHVHRHEDQTQQPTPTGQNSFALSGLPGPCPSWLSRSP
jgi:hypothetical protein